ncbi:protein kinase domain-containing protein [Streptomyces qinglanensis]|uniref:protein kinase domain-containing protein n=1 Tax=Streptomyces qinglanensis TaxID=943816 RepID=UPI0037B05C72
MLSPLHHDDPEAFGPYQLIARLGSGGMGTVYMARSPDGRTLALKTLHARIAHDADFRTRFRLEADAARVIGGEHGARVFDADPRAETPWFAAEYLIGPQLGEAVEVAGPLPEASVRRLGTALCAALGQLHHSDVVHRDLKPSNIVITAEGPKVIDFGIARALGDDRLTRAGSQIGTPAFMSPEQAGGLHHSWAGDVFGLAAVLVFAATGHGPFGDGQAAELIYRVRYTAPDLDGVPDALVPVLARALAKDPAERPTTAELRDQLHEGGGEFADDLPGAVLQQIGARAEDIWHVQHERLPAPVMEGATGPPPQAPPGTGKLSRRQLLFAGGASILGLAGAGGGAWALFVRGGGPAPAPYHKPTPGPSVSPLPKKKLDSLWQVQLGGPLGYESPASPIVIDGLAILPSRRAYGVDTASGTVRWTTRIARSWHLASDGKHVLHVVNHEQPPGVTRGLARLDLASGKDRKEIDLRDPSGKLFSVQLLGVSDGIAYLAVLRRHKTKLYEREMPWHVTALNLDSGDERWYEPIPFHPAESDDLHFLAAKVAGNRLVALQHMNDDTVRVNARDLRTGKTVWDQPLKGVEPDQARHPLTSDDKHLYLGVGRLRALRLSDGKPSWERSGRYGPPALKDGKLYVVEEGSGLRCVAADNGKHRWTQRDSYGSRAALTSRPVVGTKYAYAKSTADGVLRAVSLTSHTTHHQYRTTGTRFFADERNKVIIASDDHFLAAFPLR